jgi:hypothetical protein
MDTLRRDDIHTLAKMNAGWYVSLYLPTHRTGRELQQDPIRIKNLLSQAESRLVDNGVRSPEVKEMLAPGYRLLEDPLFLHQQSDGLALFFGKGFFRRYRLPRAFSEQAMVNSRFYLKPLLPLLNGNGRFYVLAISQKSVRLLAGSRHSIYELPTERLPKGLADTLKYDVLEKQVQFHTRSGERGGERAAMFHGHGEGKDDAKDQLLRYFRQIDSGLHDLLRNDHLPLVLAGVEYYLPIYREANSYSHLLDKVASGSPEGARDEDLHKQVWPLVEPIFLKPQHDAEAQYRQFAGTGRTSCDVSEIVKASNQGRVAALFVALGKQQWGKFNADSGEVALQDKEAKDNEDLLDCAAVHTFLNGGTVFAVEENKVPGGTAVAAVYRY